MYCANSLTIILWYFVFKTGPPSPPQDLKVVTVDNAKALLRWNPPTSNGGSPITGYALEKKDLSTRSADWTSATSTTDNSATISRLVEGHEYLFRVFAENDTGASEPAHTKQPVTAQLPYSKLTFLIILTILWNNGSNGLQQYNWLQCVSAMCIYHLYISRFQVQGNSFLSWCLFIASYIY